MKNSVRCRLLPSLSSMFCILLAVAFLSGAARAQTPDAAAREALKKMTDYVSGLDAISFDFIADLEAVTSNGMKLQFPAADQMTLDRPNKFHVTRKGGHINIELVSNGDSVTLYGRKLNAFAKKDAPESLDVFENMVREERGADLHGADLLLQNAYDQLIEPFTKAMYLGTSVVDNVEYEHLALRTPEVDWQIRFAAGDKPYPCKYVATSK